MTIQLLNEHRQPVATWQLKNAWPIKLSGPGLNATQNEVAIEEIEFAHAGIAQTTDRGLSQ